MSCESCGSKVVWASVNDNVLGKVMAELPLPEKSGKKVVINFMYCINQECGRMIPFLVPDQKATYDYERLASRAVKKAETPNLRDISPEIEVYAATTSSFSVDELMSKFKATKEEVDYALKKLGYLS